MIGTARWLVLGMVCTGCVEEGLVFCVDALVAQDTDVVDLAVTMGASSDVASVCRPAIQQISGADLEYCVAIAPGARYRESAFLRAEQRREGEEEPVAIRQFEAPFIDGEQKQYDVVLSTLCAPACCAEQQCLGDACVSLPPAGVFDADGGTVTDDVDCDTSP